MKKLLTLFTLTTSVIFCDIGDEFVSNGKGPNELTTQEYLELVAPFIPDNPTILEAGAHGGNDTVIMGHRWPRGHLYAFEPVAKFYLNMKHELNKHKVYNVTTIKKGLFTVTGNRTFYISQNCGGASSFLQDNDMCNYNDYTVTVPCVNLDEWAEENNVESIDFMWLDMEGAEYYVLSSAPKILSTTRVILTELNFKEFRKGSTQYHTLKNFLLNQGFKLHKIWGSPYHQATGMFVRADLVNN